jgi:hypothetical protein
VRGGGRSYASGGPNVSCWTVRLIVSLRIGDDKEDLQGRYESVREKECPAEVSRCRRRRLTCLADHDG